MALKFSKLEWDVLQSILAGEDPVLMSLRHQLESTTITGREMTGVGFYLNLLVDSKIPPLHREHSVKPDFAFGGVPMSTHSLQNGAGFVIFVREGYLDFLEGYTYGEAWPEEITDFHLGCSSGQHDLDGYRKIWSTQ